MQQRSDMGCILYLHDFSATGNVGDWDCFKDIKPGSTLSWYTFGIQKHTSTLNDVPIWCI